MHAVSITLAGLPTAVSRWVKARITGVYRTADNVAIDRTARTGARPPQITRRPRRPPLS